MPHLIPIQDSRCVLLSCRDGHSISRIVEHRHGFGVGRTSYLAHSQLSQSVPSFEHGTTGLSQHTPPIETRNTARDTPQITETELFASSIIIGIRFGQKLGSSFCASSGPFISEMEKVTGRRPVIANGNYLTLSKTRESASLKNRKQRCFDHQYDVDFRYDLRERSQSHRSSRGSCRRLFSAFSSSSFAVI